MEEKVISVPASQLNALLDAVEGMTEPEAASAAAFLAFRQQIWRLGMVSLLDLAPSFDTLVQKLGERLGKQVAISFSGLDLEVRLDLRQALSTAFLHAIRNSIDHGIGQSGSISIEAEIRTDRLHLSISDDGIGPNLERIRSVAVKKNLVEPAAAMSLSSDQLLELLFAPGFSTQTESSEISGRGVGLDAVRAAFHDQQGQARCGIARSGRGFVLELEAPLEALGMQARSIWIGACALWAQSSQIEEVAGVGSLSAAELAQAERIEAALGWRTGADSKHIRIRAGHQSFCIRMDGIGPEEFRLFRPVPPIWGNSRAPWILPWIRAGSGRALGASPPSSGLSRQPLAMLATASQWAQLAAAATG